MLDSIRLTTILHFLETIDQFKTVYRTTYIGAQSRHENDAEHTWHMAMFALLLHKELSIEIDIEHALKLILTHDLVEIYAGDTPAYDAVGHLDKKEREEQAAQALFAQLPADLHAQIDAWWREFEEGQTSEARYAHAMDKLQAFAQNVFSQGQNWHDYNVTIEKTHTYNHVASEFDPALTYIFELLYQRAATEHLWPDQA